jgi:hypothetical protein
MHKRPLLSCHDLHACGSPALAVTWQSAETEAGREQLVEQKVCRSSQLESGGPPFPESGVPTPPVPVESWVGVQGPR